MAYSYASVDEGYSICGIKNLNQVFIECCGLFLEDGSVVSDAKHAKELLSKGAIRLYDYDKDDLKALDDGESVRKDWQIKIVKL